MGMNLVKELSDFKTELFNGTDQSDNINMNIEKPAFFEQYFKTLTRDMQESTKQKIRIMFDDIGDRGRRMNDIETSLLYIYSRLTDDLPDDNINDLCIIASHLITDLNDRVETNTN
jgi:hypothetical protein